MNDELRREQLGTYLRSLRQRLTPESVGLRQGAGVKRRIKGLRREEVSALAGISLPWYTALEQGRDIQVSDQVLDSLARALFLDQDERRHLFYLAKPRNAKQPLARQPEVSDSLMFVLNQLSEVPAYITDQKMTVLASNDLASYLFGSFESETPSERNLIWRMFMMPSHRDLYVNWEAQARSLIGHFRVLSVRNMEDPWYNEMIAALMDGSPKFASWWEYYDVSCTFQYPPIIAHPVAGRLNLKTHLFRLQGGNGEQLTTFVPDPEDGSAARLAKLAGGLGKKPTLRLPAMAK